MSVCGNTAGSSNCCSRPDQLASRDLSDLRSFAFVSAWERRQTVEGMSGKPLLLCAASALVAVAGCGSQASQATPSTPGMRGARATLELFGRDIVANRADAACGLLSSRALLGVSGRLAAAERTPASGVLPDEVCAGAVAIVRADLAGGQTTSTQLNRYLRSVRLTGHGQVVVATGAGGALSTLSYQRGRWNIER